MAAKARRLKAKSAVERELYAKSGNQCAFPGCHHVLVDSEGNAVGQVCHIEAAKEGGERFNPDMTDEERRALSNLILLCYRHHVVTNDVEKYSVEALRRMKADHEAMVKARMGMSSPSVEDETKSFAPQYASSLARYCEVFGLTEEHIRPPIDELLGQLKEFADELRRIPQSTRALLVILLERGEAYDLGSTEGVRVLPSEIEHVTRLNSYQIQDHVSILKQRQLARIIVCEEDGIEIPYIFLFHESGINMWLDVKTYCTQTGTPLAQIIRDLQFQLLD